MYEYLAILGRNISPATTKTSPIAIPSIILPVSPIQLLSKAYLMKKLMPKIIATRPTIPSHHLPMYDSRFLGPVSDTHIVVLGVSCKDSRPDKSSRTYEGGVGGFVGTDDGTAMGGGGGTV